MKSKRYAQLTIVYTFVLMCASCGIYHPQLAEVPLIDHKGDIRLSTKFTTPVMINATISAGLTEHIAAQVHADVYSLDATLHYSHLALGYYHARNNTVLEGYAGVGFNYGAIGNHAYNSSGRCYIPFVQVNYGWEKLTKANIDVGAAIKAGAIFPNMHTDTETGYQYNTRFTAGLVEPQVFLRIGGETVKYSIQAGWCYSNMKHTLTGWWHPFTFGMGMTVFVK